MSNIKRYFRSRFGVNGCIIQADYSQLEVCGLAVLSGDDNLISDINLGKDMHCINASFLYSTPYEVIKNAVDNGDKEWIKKRKTAKAPGFLIQLI